MANDKDMLKQEALKFHASGRPGKIEIKPTKPLTTQRHLALAYSPGVAQPCLEIADNPDTAYDYTSRGNLVAVISNGTAVLGLGNIGALASKPVMEGKAVLFKRFADIDGIDLEVDTSDVDEFINAVKHLGPSFGGINLEDIRAPECFIIEQTLRDMMDIPVFHDDQHGTAIVAAAAIKNACEISGRNLEDIKLVVNGAGSAGIACVELVKAMGIPHDNVIMCDTRGVIYKGRGTGMNQWKEAHAVETDKRTLEEALEGADAFFGVSAKGAVTQGMVKRMAPKPIIMAMANPDPEITPEEARAAVPDSIIATGRSDYPNQVNNVLGFPYIFRGALDVRATTINEDMKIAAVNAIAELAREDVPDEVAAAYGDRRLSYGPDYILPVPFDPRLIHTVPVAVARAAIESGVARREIEDWDAYVEELKARLDPTASVLQLLLNQVKSNPHRVVFAEGEEERVIRAAVQFKAAGFGCPVLIGREDSIRETAETAGIASSLEGIEIHNARLSDKREEYADFLYERLQRRGYLRRDVMRMVNQDRNVFGACMVARGDADSMVTGSTRRYSVALHNILSVANAKKDKRVFSLSVMVINGRTVFIADTAVNLNPTAEELAIFAEEAAKVARRFGHEPRVAFLSFSTFTGSPSEGTQQMKDAVDILNGKEVDFEYEGDLAPDIALNHDLMKQLYPFAKLSGPANVLIMPDLHAANISYKLLRELAGGEAIGPFLLNLEFPIQIVPVNASMQEIVNMAALSAHEAFA